MPENDIAQNEQYSAYNTLSKIYDIFNSGFNYTRYFNTIKKALEVYDNPFGEMTALDCGCGTGSLMELLTSEGFDCTGVDISPEMLDTASKKPKLKNARLICQDLSEIDLYKAYNIAFCSLDTINHICDKRKLRNFFSRIYNFIEMNGFFIFDVKTEKGFIENSKTTVHEQDGNTLIFDGFYKKPYMYYCLSCFYPIKNSMFKRLSADVEERFYSDEDIKEFIKNTAFKKVKTINFGDRKIFILRKGN